MGRGAVPRACAFQPALLRLPGKFPLPSLTSLALTSGSCLRPPPRGSVPLLHTTRASTGTAPLPLTTELAPLSAHPF